MPSSPVTPAARPGQGPGQQQPGQQQSQSQQPRVCRVCSGNHNTHRCNKLDQILKDAKNKRPQAANIVSSDPTPEGEGDPSAFTCAALSVHSSHHVRDPSWYLDSAASHSYSYDRGVFATYSPLSSKIPIRVGNGELIHAIGRGDVKIVFPSTSGESGPSLLLRDVLHVPNISANLISISSLDDHKITITFGNRSCILSKDGKKSFVASARKSPDERLYRIDPASTVVHTTRSYPYSLHLSECSCSFIAESAELIHKRLGHLNHESMLTLRSKSTGLEFVDGVLKPCDSCLKAKHPRTSFASSKRQTAKKILSHVSSDVCGPFDVSVSQKKYFVSFVDHHSRFVRLYFIREKSDVLECFRDFKAWSENQLETTIKTFTTDGGGEYVSNEFKSFLSESGIEWISTPPRTPELNGLAERVNRTIGEMGKSLMFESGLTSGHWPEAFATACYIRNRVGTKALGGKTPFLPVEKGAA